MEKQAIILGYYANKELLGFRADSFGSLTMTKPKIYHYSQEQVTTIINNVRDEMNGSSSKFFKKLMEMDVFLQDMQGNTYDKELIVEEVEKQEKAKKEYKDFEIHVLPFIGYDENYAYPEEYKVKIALNNLSEPLEIHKFTTIENQN